MSDKSPFPGMDPWIEQHWGDVHGALVTYTRDALQQRLPPGLKARMQERVFVESLESQRTVYPDIRVFEHPGASPSRGRRAEGAVALAEPVTLRLPQSDPATETYIEITDVDARGRVVTIIEVLSPANKVPGQGQDLHLQKQREARDARTNLVEIDLLRIGRRVLLMPWDMVRPELRTPYAVCIFRGWKMLVVDLYPIPLRSRLPIIAIPLRQDDTELALDLQSLFEQAYRNGGYDDLDYRRDPHPPLEPGDVAWADELLRAAGRR